MEVVTSSCKDFQCLGKIHVLEAGMVLYATHVGEEFWCLCTSDGTMLFSDYFALFRGMSVWYFIKTQLGSGQSLASDFISYWFQKTPHNLFHTGNFDSYLAEKRKMLRNI